MLAVQFLSDAWIDALDRAARDRVAPADDPLAAITTSLEQRITDGPTWRMVIDHGAVSVAHGDDADATADVRMSTDRATARAIACGERAALDAFIQGDLVLGGDVRVLLEHRLAFETLGDLFAAVKADTEFE